MKNEFFGLSQRWGLKSGLFKQNLAQSPKTQARQGGGDFSLSLVSRCLLVFKGILKRTACGLPRRFHRLAMTNSRKMREFTHPQTPSAREGAFR